MQLRVTELFYRYFTKTTSDRKKIINRIALKLSTVVFQKMPSKKWKDNPTEWEEIFEIPGCDKGLLTRIYKEHLQLNDETVSMNLSIHPAREDVRMSNQHMKRYSKSLVIRDTSQNLSEILLHTH